MQRNNGKIAAAIAVLIVVIIAIAAMLNNRDDVTTGLTTEEAIMNDNVDLNNNNSVEPIPGDGLDETGPVGGGAGGVPNEDMTDMDADRSSEINPDGIMTSEDALGNASTAPVTGTMTGTETEYDTEINENMPGQPPSDNPIR